MWIWIGLGLIGVLIGGFVLWKRYHDRDIDNQRWILEVERTGGKAAVEAATQIMLNRDIKLGLAVLQRGAELGDRDAAVNLGGILFEKKIR